MLRSVSVLIALSLSITGCATKYSESYNQNQTEQNSSEKNILEQVEENTVDSESTFIEAEKRYATALKANMAFYSPRNIQNAKESLKLARAQELNAEKEASLKSSKNVLSLLDEAQKNKIKVEELLPKILTKKKVLEELKTPRILAAEYNTQIDDIQSIIKKIEANESNDISKRITDIYSALETLELNTLLEIYWQPAKNTLLKAKKENADKNAPKSFSLAVNAVNKAEDLIRNDYADRIKVESYGITALRTAQQALYISRDAELLVDLTAKQAENKILQFQELLAKIGTALESKELRHMALEDQANALAQIAETQASRLTAPLNEKITKLQSLVDKLQVRINNEIKN